MRTSVTFLSDGLRDYVLMPDGVRYILGTLSVAKLLQGLVSTWELRRVCEAFNEGKQPKVAVDIDALQEALEMNIRRSRWAATTSSLIHVGNRQTPMMNGEGRNMTAESIQNAVSHIEGQVTLLQKQASNLSKEAKAVEVEKLRKFVADLASPATPAAPAAVAPTSVEAPSAKVASASALEANTALVDETLATVQATDSKIERLVAAGKKFNHVAAKTDLYKIASRVEEIVASVDLAYGWVKDDLTALAKQASDIHALFPTDL